MWNHIGLDCKVLHCLTEMQYHILRSIATLAIMHVMSRPGAVRGQQVQHYCWDSAKDCNKMASKAASMEQVDNCFNKRRRISTPPRSRQTNAHYRTHFQVTCIKIKAAWPHAVHPIRISLWSLGREVEKTKERKREEQEAGKGWGRDCEKVFKHFWMVMTEDYEKNN